MLDGVVVANEVAELLWQMRWRRRLKGVKRSA